MKTILYISSNYFAYNRPIKEQLEKDGFRIINMEINIPKPNFLVRRYYLKRSLKYSEVYTEQFLQKTVYPKVQEEAENIDIVLLGLVTLKRSQLECIKKLAYKAKFVLPLFDDIDYYKATGAEANLDLFDVITSYYKKDADACGFHYNPNFYDKDRPSTRSKYDWSYVGTETSARKEVLTKILKQIEDEKFFLYLFKGRGGIKDQVKCLLKNKSDRNDIVNYYKYKELSYEKTLKVFSDSRCILDIQHPWQKGLSMRPFHAMSLHTKLITSNPEIKEYDFYNPSNVWVIDYDNPQLPPRDFFEKEYEELLPDIYKKYSVASWCKRLEEWF